MSKKYNDTEQSDLITQPAKKFFNEKLGLLFFLVLNTVALLFVFPLTPFSTILGLAILLFAIWLTSRFKNSNSIQSKAIKFWFIVIIIFIFSALRPFIFSKKPLYVGFLNDDNPFKSSLHAISNGKIKIGGLLILPSTDIIREKLAILLSRSYPYYFHVIRQNDYNGTPYYNLPVFDGFIFDSSEPGSIVRKKTIYFPVDALQVYIEINLAKPNFRDLERSRSSFDFRAQINMDSFLDFAYEQYPDTVPWEAVQVDPNQEENTLNYVALLDRSFELFAEGRSEDALGGLNKCAENIPTQNVEGTRLGTLQLLFVQSTLTGNVGELQSLPFLHKAFNLFVKSEDDPRFKKDYDPLKNWVRNSLLNGYLEFNWSSNFLSQIATLTDLSNAEPEGKPYTDVLEEKLNGKTYDELLDISMFNNQSSAELHFLRQFTYSKFVNESLAEIPLIESNAANSEVVLNNMRTDAKKTKKILNILDALLVKKGQFRPTEINTFPELFIKLLSARSETMSQTDFSQMVKNVDVIVPNFHNITNLINGSQSMKNLSPEMNAKWWTGEYLAWFCCWSVNALMDIKKYTYPWLKSASDDNDFAKFDMKTSLSKYGNDYFIKDEAGKGQVFLPGLFFLSWYDQTFNPEEGVKLKQLFEEEARMPFGDYVSQLFPVEDIHENLLDSTNR